ncbi:endonuclease NucS domain-containing protein [Aeribacillus sp. FSL K6-2848]|uniref:endonuclease NucS domain-containing protein n=1 Tax=Aeribacillus sp. FSL K6-2848 TaxID=2954612 RepID=UPI0030F78123
MEDKIRDQLAANLAFIERGLELIEKEYMLENFYGTKGFIDILAKDSYNRFVIIELKRSNQASRQAIHEIMKYVGLLKRKFKVKESEIRVIIISTHWDELIIPFSELLSQTSYFIEGYQIEIDDNYNPISKTKVAPIANPAQRKFSLFHYCFYCEDKKTVNALTEIIKKATKSIGFENYILIHMETVKRNKYPNPFALYFVPMCYTKEQYREILSNISRNDEDYHIIEEFEEYIENDKYNGIDSEVYYLEQALYTYINKKIYEEEKNLTLGYFFLESGSPEALTGSIKDWSILEILRFGFLKEDIRLEDKQIILETMGLSGGNSLLFHDICATKFKAKFKEIRGSVKDFLKFNDTWQNDIKNILDAHENSDALISLYIYNPNNILEALYTSIYTEGKTLPCFEIIVDFMGGDVPYTLIYIGEIRWNGKKASLKDIVNKHFYNNKVNILMAMTIHSIESLNPLIMQDLGLEFVTNSIKIEGNKKSIYKSTPALSRTKDMFDFYNENYKFIMDLKEFFDTTTTYPLYFDGVAKLE